MRRPLSPSSNPPPVSVLSLNISRELGAGGKELHECGDLGAVLRRGEHGTPSMRNLSLFFISYFAENGQYELRGDVPF